MAQKANDSQRGTYDKRSLGSARNEWESFLRLLGRAAVPAPRLCRFLASSSDIPQIIEARRASRPIGTPHIKP